MSPKFQKTLLDHLQIDQWKSVSELIDEIKTERERRSPIRAYFKARLPATYDALSGPSFGSMYVSLEELKTDGLAEWRYRNISPEQFYRRGRRRMMEWRLTNKGKRMRSTIEIVDGAV